MKNKKIEFDGKEFKSLREFADFYSINFSTFYKHLRQGESIENIIAMHSKRIKYTENLFVEIKAKMVVKENFNDSD